MENLLSLWNSSGLAQIHGGQAFMIVIGLLLLFLAIRKGFEPLLLVPIGFGGILANIPGAGLAYSAIDNAMQSADPLLLAEFARVLGSAAADSAEELSSAFAAAPAEVKMQVKLLAVDAGFSNGMLYNFYNVAIASGVNSGLNSTTCSILLSPLSGFSIAKRHAERFGLCPRALSSPPISTK